MATALKENTSVAKILSENKFLLLTANNRIKCDITGHEMPVRLDVIQTHLKSKKLQKAKEWYFC